MRKVYVLTGKRGGYGAMKQMLKAFDENKNINLSLAVTDQHLDKKFGYTVNEIKKDFEVQYEIPLYQKGSSSLDRAIALSNAVKGISLTLEESKPDICILYGDRGEVLSAALAATTLGTPIAHIQGGDQSGSVDEQMRHSITKLSHLHYVSNSQSALNVEMMGEEKWRVLNVGDCHLDEIMSNKFFTASKVKNLLSLDTKKKIAILLQHPETTEPEKSYLQMKITLEALKSFDFKIIAIKPCSDVGYEGIIKALNEYSEFLDMEIFSNLEAPLFWGLQNIANLFIGNSSAGIIESTTFKLPTINIGRRQNLRLSSQNIISVSHNVIEIENAIKKILFDKDYLQIIKSSPNLYGNGKAGSKIADHISKIKIDKNLILKNLSYATK